MAETFDRVKKGHSGDQYAEVDVANFHLSHRGPLNHFKITEKKIIGRKEKLIAKKRDILSKIFSLNNITDNSDIGFGMKSSRHKTYCLIHF